MFCEELKYKPAKFSNEGIDALINAYKNGPLGSMGAIPRDGITRQPQQIRIGHPKNRGYRYKTRICKNCGNPHKSSPSTHLCPACRINRDRSAASKAAKALKSALSHQKRFKAIYGPQWRSGDRYCSHCNNLFNSLKPEHFCPECRIKNEKLKKYRDHVCRIKRHVTFKPYKNLPDLELLKEFNLPVC